MDFSNFNIIIPPQDIEQNPQCLERIAAGDRSSFEWLYKNYCSKLYNYILLLTADKFLSEDITQEVFLKIWTKREILTSVTNFNSYLYMSAKNLLLDKWRKKQNEKEAIKNLATTQEQTERNLFYQRSEEQQVAAAVATLTPKQQLIYKMIREEGHSRSQVSQQLNIAPNTVKATMQHALHHLRKRLL
jgi:RNA polymerase sigma-70 factor (ECF subfamily)